MRRRTPAAELFRRRIPWRESEDALVDGRPIANERRMAFGKPEIQQYEFAARSEPQIRRFDVAVDDRRHLRVQVGEEIEYRERPRHDILEGARTLAAFDEA